jgi:hypothetical protein
MGVSLRCTTSNAVSSYLLHLTDCPAWYRIMKQAPNLLTIRVVLEDAAAPKADYGCSMLCEASLMGRRYIPPA